MGLDHSKLSPASVTTRNSFVNLLLKQEWDVVCKKLHSHPHLAKQVLSPTSGVLCTPLHVACGLVDVPLKVVQALMEADPEGPLRPSAYVGTASQEPKMSQRNPTTLAQWSFNGSEHSKGSGSSSHSSSLKSSEESSLTPLDFSGGWLPLHVAVYYGVSPQVVQYLVDCAPSTLACKTGHGFLPLHLACRSLQDCNTEGAKQQQHQEQLQVVELLLTAFPTARYIPSSCPLYKTALEFAQDHPDEVPPALVEVLQGDSEKPRDRASSKELKLKELKLQTLEQSQVKDRRQLLQSTRYFENSQKHSQKPTKLVASVSGRQWKEALDRLTKKPREARVWTLSKSTVDPPCHSLPLHMALRRKAPVQVIQALVEHYPTSTRSREYYGMTPLHVACQSGVTLDVVQLLVEQCPEAVKTPDLLGLLPLHLACLSEACRRDVIVCLLEAHPPSLQVRDQKGFLPLDYIHNGLHPHVKRIEADFTKGVDYWGALSNELGQFLVKRQWDEALESLRNNPDQANRWIKHPVHGKRRYALHMACRGRPPVPLVQALLEACPQAAQVDIDEFRLLPLHLAVQHGASADIVQLLLDAFPQGAAAEDSHGLLPLHLAVTEGSSVPVCKMLVDAHPQAVQTQDRKGFTPLVYAESSFHPNTKQVLELLQSIPRSSVSSRKASLRPQPNDALQSLQPPDRSFRKSKEDITGMVDEMKIVEEERAQPNDALQSLEPPDRTEIVDEVKLVEEPMKEEDPVEESSLSADNREHSVAVVSI